MKQKDLDIQLEEELLAVRNLRGRINELRHERAYLSDGLTLYYAVDFSEIHSYLHYNEEEDRKIIGVTLDLEDRERRFLQYRLGLTHLFNSFTETLYVLPSHTIEMWSFARTQSEKKVMREEQAVQLAELSRNLDLDLQASLLSLAKGIPSEESSNKLLTFVKSTEFGQLCVDVSEFVNSYKRGDALRGLLKKAVSPRVDELLRRHDIAVTDLKEPSEEEILDVIHKFPELPQTVRPFSTRIDARAFLYLRNINHLLAEPGARLILITRDNYLIEVAEAVSSDPKLNWPEARRCLRGIESVFLDLTLTGSPTSESKGQWIVDSDLKLAMMQESIERTLTRMRAKNSHSQATFLISDGKKLLKQAIQLWDQQINVKLSLASSFIPWLERTFQEIASGTDLPEDFKSYRLEYERLTNLLEYLSTPIYRTMAGKDIKAIWKEIENDCLNLAILSVFGQARATRLSRVLTQTVTTSSGETKSILHSKRFFKMPSLQLTSKTYLRKLKALAAEDDESYENAFKALVKEVVNRFHEPEAFLIMAFLLGLLSEWELALEVLAKCREILATAPKPSAKIVPKLADQIIPSEIDFFSSAIKRRLAQSLDDAERALELFTEAYEEIVRANKAVPNEPKYMVAEAGTTLLYHETTEKFCPWPAQLTKQRRIPDGLLTVAEAEEQMKLALTLVNSQDDIKLKVIILNNLAFAAAISDFPALDVADQYLQQAYDTIATADEEQTAILSGTLPHIDETRIMIRAKHAQAESNLTVLKECVEELRAKLEDDEIMEYEKFGFQAHIRTVEDWILKIEEPEDLPLQSLS